MDHRSHIEQICTLNVNLSSPVELDDSLYLVAQNGHVYKLREGQLKSEFHFGGQPSGIAIDKVGKNLFVADLAHQAIMARNLDDKGESSSTPELVKEFEGMSLNGPNSICCSPQYNCVYFTDSGPFGETTLETAQGSVFMIDIEGQMLRPLALNCLAYPSGLALSNDEKILYVSETCKNRILRFVQTQQGIYYFSVFYNFNGRYGPTAITVSQSDLIYVARFEFAQLAKDGIISILNQSGQLITEMVIPNSPEINGLSFSKMDPKMLYITENSDQPQCLRVYVHQEEKDDKKKDQY